MSSLPPPAAPGESSPLLEDTSNHDLGTLNSTYIMDLYPPKDTYELSPVEAVPEYMRCAYILTGYRVHFSVRLCLYSLVRLHTETFNIWTHLCGALAFVGVYLWVYIQHLQYVSWLHAVLITIYMCAVTWLLLCSASFHCFGCHSPKGKASRGRFVFSIGRSFWI